jgi:hypothetical protein
VRKCVTCSRSNCFPDCQSERGKCVKCELTEVIFDTTCFIDTISLDDLVEYVDVYAMGKVLERIPGSISFFQKYFHFHFDEDVEDERVGIYQDDDGDERIRVYEDDDRIGTYHQDDDNSDDESDDDLSSLQRSASSLNLMGNLDEYQ